MRALRGDASGHRDSPAWREKNAATTRNRRGARSLAQQSSVGTGPFVDDYAQVVEDLNRRFNGAADRYPFCFWRRRRFFNRHHPPVGPFVGRERRKRLSQIFRPDIASLLARLGRPQNSASRECVWILILVDDRERDRLGMDHQEWIRVKILRMNTQVAVLRRRRNLLELFSRRLHLVTRCLA